MISEQGLDNRYISKVILIVSLLVSKGKKLRSRKVIITTPDECNLDSFGDDLIIREMLIASGIEPKFVNLSLSCV